MLTPAVLDKPQYYDVIVLGAGAAGLMAAITASARNKRVVVLEISNKPGKKILMSGGGRCNFSNLSVSTNEFICSNPHFVKSALAQYSQWDFIGLVSEHKIPYHEKEQGQLFCDRSSKDILQMLLQRCSDQGVEILCNTETFSISKNFELATSRGKFQSDKLIIATGGLSIPTLGGASGFAYQFAEQLGLNVTNLDASLVPFTLSGKWQSLSEQLSGVSISVSALVANKNFSLPMLFTHRGLSGPAILQLSNYWYLGNEITINLLPGVDVGDLLVHAKRRLPNSSLNSVLAEQMPKSVAYAFMESGWLATEHSASDVLHGFKDEELRLLGHRLNEWRLTPSGTEGYRTAEVTRGGIDVAQLSSKTMEVNNVAGLYMVGEAVDVTGHLGGFNFQWAWSSGYVAGVNV